MKIALYIEDGREQIVLTPTNSTEKAILAKLYDEKRTVNVVRGSFYACQGGYTRRGTLGSDESTILVLDRPREPIAQPDPPSSLPLDT